MSALRKALTDSTTIITEGSNGNGLNPGQSHSIRTYVPELFTDTANWCVGQPQRTEMTPRDGV